MDMNRFLTSDSKADNAEVIADCQGKYKFEEGKGPAVRGSDSGYHSWGNIQDSSHWRDSDAPLSNGGAEMNMQSFITDNCETLVQKSDSCKSTCIHSSPFSSYCSASSHGNVTISSARNHSCPCAYDLNNGDILTDLGIPNSDTERSVNPIKSYKCSKNLCSPRHKKFSDDIVCVSNTCPTCVPLCTATCTVTGIFENGHVSNSSGPPNLHLKNCVSPTASVKSSPSLRSDSHVQYSLHTTKSVNSETQDLASKIEFCLMFGYTLTQIRPAIIKLGNQATKNDILAELSNSTVQTTTTLPQSLVVNDQDVTISMQSQFVEAGHGKRGITMTSKISKSARSPLPRGPLTLDNGNKDKDNITKNNDEDDSKHLRPIVIDGSNVAMSHGNRKYFSCKGIFLAVDYFRKRNHRDITVFVPSYRKESSRPDAPIRDRELLDKLEQEKILVYTPSRSINGRRVTCYDDRFILKLAQDTGGVIVSNDNFRDLQSEKPEWKELIEKRLLMYSFVSDRFMPPDDPLGRNGPSIDNFLRNRPASEEQNRRQCPYGKKCTYGKKCKFFHPESSRSVVETMKENSDRRYRTSVEAVALANEFINNPATTNVTSKSSTQVSTGTSRSGCPPGSSKSLPANDHQEHHNVPSSSGQPKNVLPYNERNQYQSMAPSYHLQPNQCHHQKHRMQRESLSENMRKMTVADRNVRHDHNMVCSANCVMPNDSPRAHSFHGQPYMHNDPNPPDFHIRSGNVPPPNQCCANSQSCMPVYEGNASGHRMPAQYPMHMGTPYPYIPAANTPYGHIPHMYANQSNESPFSSKPLPVRPEMAYPYPGPSRPQLPCYMPSYGPAFSSAFSHSYPFIAPSDRSDITAPLSNDGSCQTTKSDVKTYPPCSNRRVYSTPNYNVFLQGRPNSAQSAIPRPEPTPHEQDVPLSSPENPKHHLYRNLCGLFPPAIVERVLKQHPDKQAPEIIKLCLAESERSGP
ncbi:unnamed protein product [Clavelina lepadiformis]|uniref:C3H1-type domain-containing protein n=1 Tax=Clavelina lepadiformis TaxID=159417 RepID=A0ABP0G1Z0_CLALP